MRHPARQRRLIASLAETGQQTPIIVIETSGRYLVIDGHKRIAALQQLGRDTVEAVVWEMSEADALVLERSLRMSEPETALEQGWLLQEMESRLGCSIEELARRFDRSRNWVANRLALVEVLPESVQQLVREGKIAAQIAMRYLAPVARISVEHCQRMAAAFAEQPWTTRQAGEFYRAWRRASSTVRERILSAPKLFRKTQEPANTLDKELDQITAIAQRALHRLEEPLPNRSGARRKIQRAIELLTELHQRIEETETKHVEPSAASHDTRVAVAGSGQTRDRPVAEDLASKRPPCAEGELQHRTEDRAGRESYAVPPTDPGTAASVQGQPRASP
ncbi:MAG: ParB/RepB/Spo0J family partition protein [Bryobacterales bacterium]|nr:ParB/RepB/Spo0J family partition protein [Bryobacterales bacterium]